MNKDHYNSKNQKISKLNFVNGREKGLTRDKKKVITKLHTNNLSKPKLFYPTSNKDMLNGDLNSEFLNGKTEILKLFNDVGKNERKNLSPEDSKLLADKIGKYAENFESSGLKFLLSFFPT